MKVEGPITFGGPENITFENNNAKIPANNIIFLRSGSHKIQVVVNKTTLTGISTGEFHSTEPLFIPENPQSVYPIGKPEKGFVIHGGIKFTIPSLKNYAATVFT